MISLREVLSHLPAYFQQCHRTIIIKYEKGNLSHGQLGSPQWQRGTPCWKKISGKDKKYLFVTVTEKLPAPLWLTRSFFRIGNFYALKFLNYTVIFITAGQCQGTGTDVAGNT